MEMNWINGAMGLSGTPELLAGIIGIISLAGIIAGWIVWRKNHSEIRWVWIGAIIATLFALKFFSWDRWEWFVSLFLGSWASGMLAFSIMRWNHLGFSKSTSRAGGIFSAGIIPAALLLEVFIFQSFAPIGNKGTWLIFFPLTALSCVIIVVIFSSVLRLYLTKTIPDTNATLPTASEQDQRMVLQLIKDGKVSSEQGTELLNALGHTPGSNKELSTTKSFIETIAGTILIVAGFMLPWVYVVPFEMEAGYQAGYHVGALGWIILVLGIIPAFFRCIPALDKHLRVELLHIVTACIGSVLVIAMFLRCPSGIGLWITEVGFAIQFLTGFRRTSLIGLLANRIPGRH